MRATLGMPLVFQDICDMLHSLRILPGLALPVRVMNERSGNFSAPTSGTPPQIVPLAPFFARGSVHAEKIPQGSLFGHRPSRRRRMPRIERQSREKSVKIPHFGRPSPALFGFSNPSRLVRLIFPLTAARSVKRCGRREGRCYVKQSRFS